MTVLQAIAILAAGIFAGMINTVVGSGTLFTFPVLLAFGRFIRHAGSWNQPSNSKSFGR